MPVGIKGRIVKDEENNYFILCPQLGIEESGSGDIEEDIETLRNKIGDKIEEEFGKAPETVQIEKYSLSLDFNVEGPVDPVNHTLDNFSPSKGNDDDEDEDGSGKSRKKGG